MSTLDELARKRAIFDRRESKASGETCGGLEFDREVADRHGCAVTFFIPESLPDARARMAKAKAEAKSKWDVSCFYSVVVPDEWFSAEAFDAEGQKCPWLQSVQKIEQSRTCARIDPESGLIVPKGKRGGVLVDFNDARATLTVWKELRPENRLKFELMPVPQAILLAWEILRRARRP